MRAAVNEYDGVVRALAQKHRKQAVVGARRAAGMAINAWLCLAPNDAYGRSYAEHLQAMLRDASVPAHAREAARALVAASLEGGGLVSLGPSDPGPALAARTLLAWCAERLEKLQGTATGA